MRTDNDVLVEAARAWTGAGLYRVRWTDGSEDWTNAGPTWFRDLVQLADELSMAYGDATPERKPYVEPWLGLKTVYRWERTRFARDTEDERYRRLVDRDELYFISPTWFRTKMSDEEMAWWTPLWVRRSDDGSVMVASESPDRRRYTLETFVPMDLPIAGPMSDAQAEALREASGQRSYPWEALDGPGGVTTVVELGIEHKAYFDTRTHRLLPDFELENA